MSATGGTPQGGEAARDPAESALRSGLRSLLAFAETRARIAANEFEEQVLRLLEVAVWAIAALCLFAIALLLVSLLVVLVFWDSNRILAAGLLTGLYAAAGVFCVLMLRACLAARPKFLAATLAELEKDRQRMQKP